MHNAGKGFGGFSKVFVACHRTSEKLVVVKQTNVDVQNARQLEELKVCIKDILFLNKKVILTKLEYQLLKVAEHSFQVPICLIHDYF